MCLASCWLSAFIGIQVFYDKLRCALLARSLLSLAVQYWSLLNWQNLRLHCGIVAVPVYWFFDIISLFFAKFKNVVHRLEPVETPSNLSRLKVTRRLTRLKTMSNVLKYRKKNFKRFGAVAVAVWLRLFYQFTFISRVNYAIFLFIYVTGNFWI